MDAILLSIYEEVSNEGMDYSIPFDIMKDYPLFFLRDHGELALLLNELYGEELVRKQRQENVYNCGLTLKGWEHVRELREKQPDSDQAFVAMWFDDSVKPAYDDGIKPALEECGYNPMRIDLELHNEDVVHKILGEIRRSGLVVADFTRQRGGVYYEAAFANGLGINVIHTCRENDMENLHFDIRNRNTIAWKDPEDLRERLRNLIRGLGWAKPRPTPTSA